MESVQCDCWIRSSCAALLEHTHADGFDRTAVRNPNTLTALLTLAVERRRGRNRHFVAVVTRVVGTVVATVVTRAVGTVVARVVGIAPP